MLHSARVGLAATFVPRSVDLGHPAWIQHTPFLMNLLVAHRPTSFVELGVHTGNSYFAACEAVQRFGLGVECFGVDTWQGDEHAGFYGEEVFASVERLNRLYPFSRLVRKLFSDAVDDFGEESIDLIHFDGRHFFEDVQEDFEQWLPKLSRRAVALFHDIHVYERGFGVARYWEILKRSYETFEFNHGHGLGVAIIGAEQDSEFDAWFRGLKDEVDAARAVYFRLGEAVHEHHALKAAGALEAGLVAERDGLVAERDGLVAERDGLVAERDGLVAERDWWFGQFHRLRARRSIRFALACSRFALGSLPWLRARGQGHHR